MKRVLTVLAAVTAALGLAACGEKTNVLTGPTSSRLPFTVMLDGAPNANDAGLYQALADGAFTKAGLNVRIEIPSDPAEPLKLLQAGKIDAAISYEPDVFLARSASHPLVSVAAIVQKPLTSIISLGSKHITSPADLAGRTVGTAGLPYQSAYLSTILQHAGVAPSTVQQKNVGSNLLRPLLSGQVDATLGGYSNQQAVELAQAGKHPNVIPVSDAGVPTYNELVLVVKKGEIIDKTTSIRQFVQALARGYEAVRADPTAAVTTLVTADPALSENLELASLKAVLPDFFPTDTSKPWGYQDIKDWDTFGDWMLTHHLIADPNSDVILEASDNELLAGQGLA